MRYGEDRLPPLWMEHGNRDWGYDLTQTEWDDEWSEGRPSRMTTSLRADLSSARPEASGNHGLDRNCRPTSDQRPGDSSLHSPGPKLGQGEA